MFDGVNIGDMRKVFFVFLVVVIEVFYLLWNVYKRMSIFYGFFRFLIVEFEGYGDNEYKGFVISYR